MRDDCTRFFILTRHSEPRMRRLYLLFHTHETLRAPDTAIVLAFSYSCGTPSLGCGDCTRFFILKRHSEPRMRRLYSLFHTHAALRAPNAAIVLAFSYSCGTPCTECSDCTRFFILMRRSEPRMRRLYSLFHTHAALRASDAAIVLAFSYSRGTLSIGCGDCTDTRTPSTIMTADFSANT